MLKFIGLVLLGLFAALSAEASENSFDAELKTVMARWAEIKYEQPESRQEDAFEVLVRDATALRERYPKRAEPKVWEAIVRARFAGSMGVFRSLYAALPEVKKARDLLLAAEKIDPQVLDGSIYTSLGSLYYMVPGSPLGFGDSDQALRYLEKAAEMNPDGIDPNFFLGDYWREQGEKENAVRFFTKALAAPDRPARELADAGRREEIRTALHELGRGRP